MPHIAKRSWAALLILIFIAAFFSVAVWIYVTTPSPSRLPALANGDLVFQTDRSPQMLAIWFATGSLYTHVGVVELDQSGTPYVVEASRQVRKTPLKDWIGHGYFRRLTIERLPGLSPVTATRVIVAAESYLGRRYDIFFRFGKDRIYCSELIYYAFREGAGVDLGQIQPVSTLNIDNFAVRAIVERRWRRDPACQTSDVTDFASCFAKIERQEIITPLSVARDPRLKSIYSNYGFFGS